MSLPSTTHAVPGMAEVYKDWDQEEFAGDFTPWPNGDLPVKRQVNKWLVIADQNTMRAVNTQQRNPLSEEYTNSVFYQTQADAMKALNEMPLDFDL